MAGIIYRWQNTINGKGYTGKTEQPLKERDRQRFNPSAVNDSKSLKDAMVVYGKENFVLEIIQDGIMHPEILNLRERYWIRYFGDFHNGYNQTRGGDGFGAGENHPNYGKPLPETTKQNISSAMKGKYAGERNPLYGKTGEKSPNYGKKHTKQTRKKMSNARKGKYAGENHPFYGKKRPDISGENHPFYGKKRPKHSQCISGEKNPYFGKKGEKHSCTRPEYTQARWYFFLCIAPLSIDISEKRKNFYQAFSEIPRRTLQDWFRKWQAELESDNLP